MAQISTALFKFYVSTGQVPFASQVQSGVWMFMNEIMQWLIYVATFVVLRMLSIVSPPFGLTLSRFALWWISFDPGPNRRLCQIVESKCGIHNAILCFDERYVVLSCFMLYRHMSYLFNSSSRFYQALNYAMDQAYDIAYCPTDWLLCNAKLVPPSGMLLSSLMLAMVLVSQFYISTRLIWIAVHRKVPLMLNRCQYFVRILWQHAIGYLSRASKDGIIVSSNRYGVYFKVFGTFPFSTATPNIFDMEQWDSDSVPAVLDNSANTHIWTRFEDFVPGSVSYFDDSANVGVLTIDQHASRPVAQGLVKIKLKDNLGQVCDISLEEALYFPKSSVNIISVTKLAAQFNDPEGTWIQTRWRTSTFSWNYEKHRIDFAHPPGNLPVLPVSGGFSQFQSFCNLFVDNVPVFTPVALRSARTALSEDNHDSLLMVDDPARLDPAEKDRFESAMLLKDPIKVGTSARLIGNGMNDKVEVLSVNVDKETMVPYYKVALPDGHSTEVTNDLLAPLDDEDIAAVPVTREQVQEHIRTLTPKEVEALLCPPASSDVIDEIYSWHYRLGHISFMDMLHLSEHGELPC